MPVFPPPSGGGAAGGGSVTFYDEGSAIGTGTLLNFVGPGSATFSGGTAIWNASATATIQYVIASGSTASIGTGLAGYVTVPFPFTIVGARLLSNGPSVGSAVVDIWKDSYANYPPTVADTITASAKPTLASAVKYEDTTLTGWTTAGTAGDVIAYNVDSIGTGVITQLNVALTVRRT